MDYHKQCIVKTEPGLPLSGTSGGSVPGGNFGMNIDADGDGDATSTNSISTTATSSTTSTSTIASTSNTNSNRTISQKLAHKVQHRFTFSGSVCSHYPDNAQTQSDNGHSHSFIPIKEGPRLSAATNFNCESFEVEGRNKKTAVITSTNSSDNTNNCFSSPEKVNSSLSFSEDDSDKAGQYYLLDERLDRISELSQTNLVASKLLEIETILADRLMSLDYGDKVSHVYNPVDYAFKPHFQYYKRYCLQSATVVMVGMNPGPFGMAQSGVPFGDIKSVSQWLDIKEEVGSPRKVNRKRPILGFDCKRIEVSGSRLWGFFQEMFGSADNFFKMCFIYNHCPLVFMGPSGVNITPAQMSAAVKKQLNELCDEALVESLKYFTHCHTLIGIGRFAEERIKQVCKKYSLPYRQGYLMHPSPRNPTANREWTKQATNSLVNLGLISENANVKQEVAENSEKLAKRCLFDT